MHGRRAAGDRRAGVRDIFVLVPPVARVVGQRERRTGVGDVRGRQFRVAASDRVVKVTLANRSMAAQLAPRKYCAV